jgi:hypothetical protein
MKNLEIGQYLAELNICIDDLGGLRVLSAGNSPGGPAPTGKRRLVTAHADSATTPGPV